MPPLCQSGCRTTKKMVDVLLCDGRRKKTGLRHYWTLFGRMEGSTGTSLFATNLLDDVVEVAARDLVLELLLDPPVGCKVRDIRLVGRASTAGEDADDTAVPGEDDGPGIARIRKPAAFLAVGHDGNLDGSVLDFVLGEVTGERFKAVSATDGGPGGRTVLHDEEALVTVGFEVLGVSDLVVLDDTISLEETIPGISVVLLIGDVGVHGRLAEVSDGEVTACEGKKNRQLKLKVTRREKKKKTYRYKPCFP